MWDPIIEGEAEALLRAADFSVAEPPAMDVLARRLVGAAQLVEVPGLRVPSRYVESGDRIELRAGLEPVLRRFLLAHELAERHLLRLGCLEEEVERQANSLAAALCVPRRALRVAISVLGRDLPELAAALATTQSVVVLRLGEVTFQPVALLTRRAMYVRGEPWCWPERDEMFRTSAVRELERVTLSDVSRRVALLAPA